VYINSLTYSPSEVPTQSPTEVPTRSPTISPTVIPTTPTTIVDSVSSHGLENCPEIVGDYWTLVRHAPPGIRWHQATDNLMGTDEYGTWGGNQSFWSIKFASMAFDKFLFTRDNCEKWLITSKEAVIGLYGNAWYTNELRTIIASSINSTSYKARWYRRSSTYSEDPWISVTDHHTAMGTGEIVYGESSAPSSHYIDSANVYINSVTHSPSQVPTQSPAEVLLTKSPTLIPTTPLTISPTVRNVEENCPETVGNLWELVRHTPPGTRWHQATDNLMGTDEYGTPGGPTSESYWSIKFDTIAFDKFLFTRDHCEKWLITSKEAVLGTDGYNTWYANALRSIISSSSSNTSYAAR